MHETPAVLLNPGYESLARDSETPCNMLRNHTAIQQHRTCYQSLEWITPLFYRSLGNSLKPLETLISCIEESEFGQGFKHVLMHPKV